jgi:hypothetical protein
MDLVTDNASMELAMIIFILLVGPLALRYGVDSRVTDTRDRRPWI